MKIGELSKEVGIAASAIRYYESIGLLPRPQRSSGRRIYQRDDILMMRIIQKAQSLGFRVKEIKTLMTGFTRSKKPDKWDQMAKNKIVELENQITESQRMVTLLKEGLRCDCVTLEACLFLFDGR